MDFKLRIKVENLGMIKSAELDLSSLTIFAGVNNSGKSYVSRFLYSLLKVLYRNRHSIYLSSVTRDLDSHDIGLFLLGRMLRTPKQILGQELPQTALSYDELRENISQIAKLAPRFTSLSRTDEFIAKKVKPTYTDIKTLTEFFQQTKPAAAGKYPPDYRLIYRDLCGVQKCLREIIDYRRIYENEKLVRSIYEAEIKWNLQHNFQVGSLRNLVRSGAKELSFTISPAASTVAEISCRITNSGKISLDYASPGSLDSWNNSDARLIYLESPFYAKLERAIRGRYRGFTDPDAPDRLTDVPEYFYDLQREMAVNRTEPEQPLNSKILTDLEAVLGGKIVRNSSRSLVYRAKTGEEYSMLLTATGIAQLGFLGYLVDSYLIQKGTVLFYDEPEAHLHPRWQNFIIRVLYKLAEQGVHIVISTHSADIMEWLHAELKEPNKKLDELLSINLFAEDGKSALIPNKKTARALISESLTAAFASEYLRTM